LRRLSRQFSFTLLGLFLIAWATTYNAAVMCGDDVNHFHAAYGNNMYLPNFSWDWIPNRVFDLYFRNLAAALFDVFYFAAHSLFGIGFFTYYKFFSATIFAVFICGVYGYLRAALRISGGPFVHTALIDLMLAVAVLLILPWTNQVRLICYELPAFLSFLVLVELAKVFYAGVRPAELTHCLISPAALILLSFVVAFSLEAYAAILLFILVIGVLCAVAYERGSAVRTKTLHFFRRPELRPGLAVALSLGIFSILALITTILFSERSAGVHRNQPLSGLHVNLPMPGAVSFNASLCGILLVGGIFVMIGAVLSARYARLPFNDSRYLMLGLFILVLASTLIVVGLISFQADQNYFDFDSYPWGGLTLILQLMTLLMAGFVLAPADGQIFGLRVVRIFILFVLASRIAVAVLHGQMAAAQKSDLVAAAYAQVIAGADGVVRTGLSLNAIPMQERPLPTADSPEWFIRNYHEFFEKYYGVQSKAVFE